MAAVALSPIAVAAPHAGDWAALELAAHGRARDGSRAGEVWGGVALSRRTIGVRGAAGAANTPASGAVSALADHIARLALEAGLVDRVATASVPEIERATARGARRVLALGTPCAVLPVRLAEATLGLEQLYVLGTTRPADAAAPSGHDCPACHDLLNSLADLSLGAIVRDAAPWAVVRNARGRALLDTLEAHVWLDAVPAAAYRATADAAETAWLRRRPRVLA